MSKNKNGSARKSDPQPSVNEPQRGWLKMRTGLLVMLLASIAFGVFVILNGLQQGLPFSEVLPLAGLYMVMMWGVFGIMMLFFRFTRRK